MHRNCLLKHVIEGKIKKGVALTERDEKEDVSSYLTTFRKRENS